MHPTGLFWCLSRGVYTCEINSKMIPFWVHKHFATPMHVLWSRLSQVQYGMNYMAFSEEYLKRRSNLLLENSVTQTKYAWFDVWQPSSIDCRHIAVENNTILHKVQLRGHNFSQTFNSRKTIISRPNGRALAFSRELLGEKWPRYIEGIIVLYVFRTYINKERSRLMVLFLE